MSGDNVGAHEAASDCRNDLIDILSKGLEFFLGDTH